MANVNVYADEKGSPLYLDDKLVTSIDRDKAYREGYWTRVSCTIPCNDAGGVLLELRSKSKAIMPRAWIPPTETLYNETSLECAVRGLYEELTIKADPSELVDLGLEFSINNVAVTDRYNIRQIQRYFGFRWNGDPDKLEFDKREVEAVKFWPYAQIGTPPLHQVPLDRRQLKDIAKRLKSHGFLPRRGFMGFNFIF